MSPFTVREIKSSDQKPLSKLIHEMSEFTDAEKAVAMELITKTIHDQKMSYPADYFIQVAELKDDPETIIGHICYGETPMTVGTYDLYWLTTHPEFRRRRVANDLMTAMFDDLRARKARILRTETSGGKHYQGTRDFYFKVGLTEEALIKDFYTIGDHLSIFTFRF